MGRSFNFLALVVKSVSSAVIFVAVLVAVYLVGPMLETKFFPVVSKLTITKMEPASPREVKLWAYFEKKRGCEYVGISWHHRQPDGSSARVPLQLLREPGDVSSPNRPVGATSAGPWIIGIPMDEIATNSFAQLQHRCGFPWISITEFYP